jgi:sterol desaturase/sphingolipid hydroxylase (fatty acid hydroxylase superfamily)
MILLQGVFWFLTWTLMLYWIHRLAHSVPWLGRIHMHHHRFILTNPPPRWRPHNILIFQDNLGSTLDVWITEIIPTVIFCYLTGAWWILIAFYIWSAFVQEEIEHNPNFDRYPLLTSGQWHLAHHFEGPCNYGIFVSVWDKMFGTFKVPRAK